MSFLSQSRTNDRNSDDFFQFKEKQRNFQNLTKSYYYYLKLHRFTFCIFYSKQIENE